MGLKYDKVDDLDKLFEKFASDPTKIDKGDLKATLPEEDENARKEALGTEGSKKLEHKVIK
ncbi:MAG: hypothetical protein LBV67_08195 [Streptococcaceae bacterium]|nr:hypothetical protein [Streptococcaceae bacterium]